MHSFAVILLGVVKELIDYERLGAHHTSLRAKAQALLLTFMSMHTSNAERGLVCAWRMCLAQKFRAMI